MLKNIPDNYQRKNYKVGIYCRLSNDDGELKESNSIGNQKSIITKYVIDNEWNIVDYYIDDGYTGLNFERPGFKRLTADILESKISLVIVKDMSRLGRDYIQVGYYIEKFFPENKVRFIAINDNIDTEEDNGNNDITPFKAIINDMYSKDISKKVRSTFNSKKVEGKFIGAFAPYGYEKDPEHKNHLILDQEVAPIVKRIFHMYLNCQGYTSIARKLNSEGVLSPAHYKRMKYKNYNVGKTRISKWNHNSVKAILSNPVYMGSVAQNKQKKVNYKSKKMIAIDKEDWIVVKGTHESIITEKQFKQTQNLMNQKRKNFGGAKRNIKLFSGFAFCGDCGEYMTYYKTKAGTYYLICSAYKRFGKDQCTRHSIPEERLEEMILSDFRKLVERFADKDNLKQKAEKLISCQKSSTEEYEREINRINMRLDEIKSVSKSLYEDKVKGVIVEEQMLELYNDFNKEKNNLEKRKSKLLKTMNQEKKDNNLDNKVKKLIDSVINLRKLSRAILSELIEKIEIFEDEDIIIHYKIKKPQS